MRERRPAARAPAPPYLQHHHPLCPFEPAAGVRVCLTPCELWRGGREPPLPNAIVCAPPSPTGERVCIYAAARQSASAGGARPANGGCPPPPFPRANSPPPSYKFCQCLRAPAYVYVRLTSLCCPPLFGTPARPRPQKHTRRGPLGTPPRPPYPRRLLCVCARPAVCRLYVFMRYVYELPRKQVVPHPAAYTPLGARAMFGHAKQSRWSAHTRLLCARTPITQHTLPLVPPICPSRRALCGWLAQQVGCNPGILT